MYFVFCVKTISETVVPVVELHTKNKCTTLLSNVPVAKSDTASSTWLCAKGNAVSLICLKVIQLIYWGPRGC